jgi:hypothetical protein
MWNFYNTFVIKISGMAQGELRGQIQHVATQQKEYFENFDKMNRFISDHIKPPDTGPPAAGESTSEGRSQNL